MISLELFFGGIALMAVGGVFISYKYATEEYGKGFIDALMLHNSGELTYEEYEDEDGTPGLNIRIKKDEE